MSRSPKPTTPPCPIRPPNSACSPGTDMTGMKVQCTGLCVRFGKNLVLDGIDLTINEREQLALLGPSGAGKSTLLRVLLGAIRPAAGTVRIGSHNPFGSKRDLNAVRR